MKDHDFFLQRVNDDGNGHTVGDYVRAVLKIDNRLDASRFYKGNVAWLATQNLHYPDTPQSVARANIGGCFGEGMSAECRHMWIGVCGAAHPIFGQTLPTPEQAFAMGAEAGRWARKN